MKTFVKSTLQSLIRTRSIGFAEVVILGLILMVLFMPL